MNKALTGIAILALKLLGFGLFIGSLWLLVRFVAFGDNHPINAVFEFFGREPVMLNISDMSWFDSALLEIIGSLFSAAMIYTGLGSLAVIVTHELGFLIAAGGLEKYWALDRVSDERVNEVSRMLLKTMRPPK